MRLDEITKKDEFKAALSDPNYQDMLDKFKEFKLRIAPEYDIRFSHSYNFVVSEFTITASISRSKGDERIKRLFHELSIIAASIYGGYDVWSGATDDIRYGKHVASIVYHIYGDSRKSNEVS